MKTSFVTHRWWKLMMKIFTVLFVLWIVGFFLNDRIQTMILELTQRFGVVVAFIWIALANIIAGLPSTFAAIGIGVSTAKGAYTPFQAIAIITLASIVGDVIAYGLCRKYRHHFLQWLGVSEASPDYQKAYTYVQKGAGSRIVFITRFFFAGILGFVNYAAGMLQMPFKIFFLNVLFGELIWSVIWFAIGYCPVELSQFFAAYKWFFLIIAVGLIVFAIILNRSMKKKNQNLAKFLWDLLVGKVD